MNTDAMIAALERQNITAISSDSDDTGIIAYDNSENVWRALELEFGNDLEIDKSDLIQNSYTGGGTYVPKTRFEKKDR